MAGCTRNTRLRLAVALVLLLGCGPLLWSEEEPAESRPKIQYASETSFSLVLVTGNTKSLSYSFDTQQDLNILKNRINLAGRFIHSRSDGVKTAEVYYAHAKYDRQVGQFGHHNLWITVRELPVQTAFHFHLSGYEERRDA